MPGMRTAGVRQRCSAAQRLCGRSTARAQQAGKVPTIGFLGAATPATASAWTAAFTQRLGELGWVEGSNVAIEYRWAEGRSERFAEIASEFVRLKVDIIVTHSSPPVLAAKQATSVIPIVFATAGNPVGTGLVQGERMRQIGVLHVSGRQRRGRTSPPRGVGPQAISDGRNLRI